MKKLIIMGLALIATTSAFANGTEVNLEELSEKPILAALSSEVASFQQDNAIRLRAIELCQFADSVFKNATSYQVDASKVAMDIAILQEGVLVGRKEYATRDYHTDDINTRLRIGFAPFMFFTGLKCK